MDEALAAADAAPLPPSTDETSSSADEAPPSYNQVLAEMETLAVRERVRASAATNIGPNQYNEYLMPGNEATNRASAATNIGLNQFIKSLVSENEATNTVPATTNMGLDQFIGSLTSEIEARNRASAARNMGLDQFIESLVSENDVTYSVPAATYMGPNPQAANLFNPTTSRFPAATNMDPNQNVEYLAPENEVSYRAPEISIGYDYIAPENEDLMDDVGRNFLHLLQQRKEYNALRAIHRKKREKKSYDL